MKIRAFTDLAYQRSYILKSTAKEVCYQSQVLESLNILHSEKNLLMFTNMMSTKLMFQMFQNLKRMIAFFSEQTLTKAFFLNKH